MIHQTGSVPMSRLGGNHASRQDILAKSLLHHELRAEHEEVLRHKWIESEKAGHDIGFDRARTEWVIKHRSKWREARQHQRRKSEGKRG